jgi:antitoxin (DNA-binding transcriptional repressor) of toxin-antitoxin stability system
MKTISIRDLRQKWPEAESRLQVEGEIIITRDTKPVARLVRYVESEKPRQRFDPAAHARWQKKWNGGKTVRLVDKYLPAAREDRPLLRKGR